MPDYGNTGQSIGAGEIDPRLIRRQPWMFNPNPMERQN